MPVLADQQGAVQTAYVGFVSYTLTPAAPNLVLVWPTSYQDSPNTTAAYMAIIVEEGASSPSVQLPDATQVSVGQNFIINNVGSAPFELFDGEGVTLGTISNGSPEYFILTDNNTIGGIWASLAFGAGSSAAVPAQLIGYGLNAYSIPEPGPGIAKINTQILVNTTITDTPYNIQISDYGSLLVWTGSTVNFILPAASSDITPLTPGIAPPNYYVSINNAGSGIITLASSEEDIGIQGLDSFQISPGQTVTVATSGDPVMVGGVATKWFTLGYGQANTLGITAKTTTLDTLTTTLTAQDASSEIQEFQGDGGAGVTVYFPVTAGQWTIYNNTGTPDGSTAGPVIVQLSGPLNNAYTLPAGARATFFSDRYSMYNLSYPYNAGTAVLNGNAGRTVLTPVVTASSLILVTYAVNGVVTNPGYLSAGTITPGTSFVIYTTNAADTANIVNWQVINP